MLQSFIIVLREGFESFLLVAVILSYFRKSAQKSLAVAVYWAIGSGLAISAALGYGLLLMQRGSDALLEQYLGGRVGHSMAWFITNESLREGVLGAVTIVMVGSLVVYMWRVGPQLIKRMEQRLYKVSAHRSGWMAFLGVFLFTVLTISREGMETALMLLQIRDPRLVTGALLGLGAAVTLAYCWVRFGHLINVRRFFQLTGIFLLLFMVQVGIYSFHEFAEAGLLPNSDALHAATEKFSADGLYGKWFSVGMILMCAIWLVGARLVDRLKAPQSQINTNGAAEGSQKGQARSAPPLVRLPSK
jgi:high-affinity iron transporter